MDAVASVTDPAPLTVTTGPELLAVATTVPKRFPPGATKSIRPGLLTVPPGSSSQVQSTPKLSV
jgi:hypothetical protein